MKKLFFPRRITASSISKMDQPGSSNTIAPYQQDMDVEMEAGPSLKRPHPNDDTEMVFEASDGSVFFTQEDLQNQVEAASIRAGKKRKLNCGHPQNLAIDETSNSSIISIASQGEEIYVEPIYVAPTSANYPNINPINPYEPGPMTYNNEQNFMYGNWILVTNLKGGWTYKFVKLFFRRQLGLVCMKGRPLPGIQPARDDFRLIVPFASKRERDRILEYLLRVHVTHYFKYSTIDVLPVGSYDSDSEDENDSKWSTQTESQPVTKLSIPFTNFLM